MKKFLLLLLCMPLLAVASSQPVHIIPVPVHIEYLDGDFIIDDKTTLHFNHRDQDMVQVADFISSYIGGISAYRPVYNQKTANSIIMEIADNPELGKEGYQLRVTPQNITITANGREGIFYGMQSIFQTLTPVRTNAALVVPGMQITGV